MPGLTPAQKNQRDFNKLVDKLADRALRSMPIYMLPREVQLLVACMDEITMQAMLLQKFVQKYPDLWANLVESLRDDQSGSNEDREGDRRDDEVDPEDLHNTLTPERPGPVAGVANA